MPNSMEFICRPSIYGALAIPQLADAVAHPGIFATSRIRKVHMADLVDIALTPAALAAAKAFEPGRRWRRSKVRSG